MNKLVLFLITCLMVSCSRPTPPTSSPIPTATLTQGFCDVKEITDFRDKFMLLLQKYYDQVQITSAAPKISMADQIDRLKDIRKNVEDLSTNQCTIKLNSALLNAVTNSIEGFSALLSGKPQSIQDSFFDEGTKFIRQVNLELAQLADCLPNCIP